jgi:hypothetical protein
MALEASVQTDHGCAGIPASNTNSEQQKQERGALIGRKFPWEENYDEMANA